MGAPSRVLTEGDVRAITEVVTGMMIKAHPPHQPYQSQCDSCRKLSLGLHVWLQEHRVEERR